DAAGHGDCAARWLAVAVVDGKRVVTAGAVERQRADFSLVDGVSRRGQRRVRKADLNIRAGRIEPEIIIVASAAAREARRKQPEIFTASADPGADCQRI